MDNSVNMSRAEREQRMRSEFSALENQSTVKWAEAFLRDLKRA